jgi:hypothetical protein
VTSMVSDMRASYGRWSGGGQRRERLRMADERLKARPPGRRNHVRCRDSANGGI